MSETIGAPTIYRVWGSFKPTPFAIKPLQATERLSFFYHNGEKFTQAYLVEIDKVKGYYTVSIKEKINSGEYRYVLKVDKKFWCSGKLVIF